MRPTILNPLFASLTALPGIGAKTERLYRRLLSLESEARVIDLLFHLPVGSVDRRARPKLSEVVPGTIVTVAIEVEKHQPPRRPQGPFLIYTSDDTNTLTIAYFSARPEFIQKLLPIGAHRYVSGTVTSYDGMLQMAHPDRVAESLDAMPMIEPVYPLTAGLTANALRRSITTALGTLDPLPEWIDRDTLAQTGFPSFAGALAGVHQPAEPDHVAVAGPAWSRLAYDEMLAFQLELALERAHFLRPGEVRPARRAPATAAASIATRLRAALPFRLTASQDAAIAAIAADLQRPKRMLRLLQGDVGSGKTIVALFACAAAIEGPPPDPPRASLLYSGAPHPDPLPASGAKEKSAAARCDSPAFDSPAPHAGQAKAGDAAEEKEAEGKQERAQAALMAPTEILARQHFSTIAPLAGAAGMRTAILTGRERGSERAGTLSRLARGEIDVLIGTHALFSADVVFRNLTLAVIDEQQRFGVGQRLALAAKGAAVDLLMMTATPIPQTLVWSWFGDMEVSELRDKPAGRPPIATRALPLERVAEVIAAVGRALAGGRHVYWVCPLVDDSESAGIAAAEKRAAALTETFGTAVALVHGRMRGDDKQAVMARFAAGEKRLLVATSVIEVGVDVPAASVMVIEEAERFGLAQLHQLRGRVGRGTEEAACLLLYKSPLGTAAKARLAILRETDDGFRIAEEDLRLRREGDLFGRRQSGATGFRIADLAVHGDLLRRARENAAAALAHDPRLVGERGKALRTLLCLFERNAAVSLLEPE